MRARNREINIFNMSLLDILTGMLGAFLFLMLGLVPYYTQVQENKLVKPEELKRLQGLEAQNADLQKEIDRLQSLVAASGGNGLSQGQVQQMLQEQQTLRQQLQDAQAENQKMSDEQSKWPEYSFILTSKWDSPAADFDVYLRYPDGEWAGPKIGVLPGAKVYTGSSIESHYQDRTAYWEVASERLEPGTFNIAYRLVSKNAPEDGGGLQVTLVALKRGRVVSSYFAQIPGSAAAVPGKLYLAKQFNFDAKDYLTIPVDYANLPKEILPPLTANDPPSPVAKDQEVAVLEQYVKALEKNGADKGDIDDIRKRIKELKKP